MRGKDLIAATLFGGAGGSSGGGGIPQADIDAAFAALAEKGVTVPDGATSADLDDLIASIVAGGGGWSQSGTFVCEENTPTTNKGAPVDDSNGEPQMLFFFKDSDSHVSGGLQKSSLMVAANLCAAGGKTLVYGVNYYSSNFTQSAVFHPYVSSISDKPYKLTNGQYYVAAPSYTLSVDFLAGVRYRWLAIGGLPE